jgi:hypothetical protein
MLIGMMGWTAAAIIIVIPDAAPRSGVTRSGTQHTMSARSAVLAPFDFWQSRRRSGRRDHRRTAGRRRCRRPAIARTLGIADAFVLCDDAR